MKLVWFEVNGFKRFAELTKVYLDGKVVAIVGPNEAGKSSLLQAFEHCNSTEAVMHDGPSQETTRGESFPNDHVIFEATYLIDDSDREGLSEIPEAADVRWYSVSKTVGGSPIKSTLKPMPNRDLTQRRRVASEIERIKDVVESSLTSAETQNDESQDAERLRALLLSEEETLEDEGIELIRTCANRIEESWADRGIAECEGLAADLRSVLEYETCEHPAVRARRVLEERRPKFLKFSEDDRNLESEYNLSTFFNEEQRRRRQTPPIPTAIQNLADSCNLSLQALYNARQANDEGKIESLLDDANAELKHLMHDTWSQSEVTVRLRLNQYQLHILVGASGEQFVRVAERSDGLRQFVALAMFLSRIPDLVVRPILLIDEAESHLHYDAQADLVQMLTKQNLAAKVIYTTHSIGCLPEDLGTGVRLVEPIERHHSKITNWFWDSDIPGFSCLLFGMGASTLAFVPIRFAVLTEGAADILLLPSLLRNAANLTHLGFQVAPGLSSATPHQFAIVDHESPRTVFLTDSDESGLRLQRKIISAGISEERTLTLPEIDGSGAVIEDFVDANAYVQAVNRELGRSHGLVNQFAVADLGVTNRPKSLADWCEKHGIRTPNKTAIAYQILEWNHKSPIVSEEHRADLRGLLAAIQTCLGLGSEHESST
jgi:predicted ATP-dependent endonuclease of OLD family